MALKLLLENGEIKRYRTSFGIGCIEPPSAGEHTTLCGKKWPDDPGINEECDHLDCAISVSERGFRQYGGLSLFIVVFCIIVGFFWQDGREFLLYCEFPMALIFGLVSIKYYHNKLNLKEFKNHGSIYGIKARKIEIGEM